MIGREGDFWKTSSHFRENVIAFVLFSIREWVILSCFAKKYIFFENNFRFRFSFHIK